MHSLHVFDTRTKIHTFQVCPVHQIDPLNLPETGIFLLYNSILCVSLKKWERFPQCLYFVLLHPSCEHPVCTNRHQLDTGTASMAVILVTVGGDGGDLGLGWFSCLWYRHW